MNQWQKKIINWIAVLLWLGVIYYFSNQPDLKSDFEPWLDLVLRKIAHMAEYFVLNYLIFRAISGHNVRWYQALIISAGLAILYAVSDEWHQSFIRDRSASIIDVGIDSIGAITASIILFFRYKRL